MFRVFWSFSTVLLILAAGTCLYPESAANPIFPGAHKILQNEILESMQKDEEMRVIVGLTAQNRFLGLSLSEDKPLMRQIQAEIKYLQDQVISRMNPQDFSLIRRFENMATFSCVVTTQGLMALSASDEVAYIEKDRKVEPHLSQGMSLIHGTIPRSTYDGQGISIAIVDTGIDYTHPMLGGGDFPNSKVIGGYDFGDNNEDPMDCHYHGTCCAGIAAGDLAVGPGDYIGGVAPAAKLYALKIVKGCEGGAYESNIAAAWDWVVSHKNDDPENPILLISTSFGGGYYTSLCDSSRPTLTSAAANAVANGISIFSSSGNDGYCEGISSPSCIGDVISVGAVYDANLGGLGFRVNRESCVASRHSWCPQGDCCLDSTTAADQVACYSNSSSFLDLLAPSHYTYTTDLGGTYNPYFGGTSAACPYAAGAAAVLQHYARESRGYYLAPAELAEIMIHSGDLLLDSKSGFSKPRVNLERSIANLPVSTPTYTPIATNTPTAAPTWIAPEPTITPTAPPTPLCEILALEDFEPPCTDWDTNARLLWTESNDTASTVVEGAGGGPASTQYGQITRDSSCITTINTSGIGSITLSFYASAVGLRGNERTYVEISVTNGTSWITVFSKNGPFAWTHMGPYSLSALSDGATDDGSFLLRCRTSSRAETRQSRFNNILVEGCYINPPTITPTPTPTPIPAPLITSISRDKTTSPISDWTDITFTTVAGVWYDVEFTFSLANPSWSSLGSIQAMGTSATFRDNGPVFDEKYYRVKVQGGDISDNQAGILPVTVIGKSDTESYQLAMIGTSLRPTSGSNIQDVLGFQGSAAWDMENADEVWRWIHRTNSYKRAWLFDSAGQYPVYDGLWFDPSTGTPSHMSLAPGSGYWIRNKSRSDRIFYFDGLVPQEEVPVDIDVHASNIILHQMGQPLPFDVPLDESNTSFMADGALAGWDISKADEIWSYVQEIDVYQRSWLLDSDGYYPDYDGVWFDLSTGSPTSQILTRGLGWWYISKPDSSREGTPSWIWTQPIPY